MPVRLSGMVSGMDTESLVTALVSGYQTKKDNLVKAQTKLSWKQEKWKTMNTSIYSFYSGKLSAGRLSSAYNLKKSTVSNSSVATVTASSSAVAGTQQLKVTKLASSGYLTGGEITSTDGSKVTGSSKITDVTGNKGSFTLSVDGKSTNIELTDDMTVNQFIAKLKDAGVQASFDENNQRFFISSKTSGKEGDFTLVANDTDGMASLNKLGLSTSIYDSSIKDDENQSETYKEYKKWADYWSEYNQSGLSDEEKANTELGKIINEAYNSQKTNFDTVAKELLDNYSKAVSAKESFENKYQSDTGLSALANANSQLTSKKAQLQTLEDKKAADNGKLSDEDQKEYDSLKASVDELTEDIKNYNTNNTLIKDYEDNKYVNVVTNDIGTKTVSAIKETDADSSNGVSYIKGEVESRNEKLYSDIEAKYTAKAKNSSEMLSNIQSGTGIYAVSKGAVRIDGQDSEIELNGATFTSNTNNYSINGLTIQVTEVTGENNSVTITTDTDVDSIYNSIKDMFSEYNKLIKSMDEAYNADSSKGYEPLTDDEKDAMSDTEVEKWETKIKDSLLRKDTTLNSVINTLKNDMASSFTINGKSYSLASFGIATLGYFSSGDNEKGVYHIDGDKDDTSTSGNDDKLRTAIASDPETVVSFFSQLCTKVYTDLGNKMAASSVSSVYTVYNDKQMNTQYSEYNTKISEAETKISTWEDYYYSKFSAMESALAKLNSQSSSLSGLFGN